ncbi:MAG: hypothetical protein HUJ59_03115 [Bacilli bacterium]|nr:hypothetical protein [Bacilli bacterium]
MTACRHVKGYSSILLFKTDDLIHYSFVSVLKTFDNPTPLKPDGMVECPDIIFEGDKCALIYSLQHKPQNGDINLIPQAPVSYEVGYLDLDEGVFTAIGKVHALDKGFDCYATQTLSKDGKNYIVWWSNLWDVNYPSEKEGYVGQLSLVKKIRIHDHTLRMEFLPDTPNIIQIDLETVENMSYLEIGNITVKFNKEKKLIYVTRYNMDTCIKTADGNILDKRIFSLPYLDTLYLEVSIDHSCVELSFNKGQKFLSILNYAKNIPEQIPVIYKDSEGDLIYAFLDR